MTAGPCLIAGGGGGRVRIGGYFVVHVLQKTTKLNFWRSVFYKDDNGKVQLVAFPREVIVFYN